jgi:hypothetical protein
MVGLSCSGALGVILGSKHLIDCFARVTRIQLAEVNEATRAIDNDLIPYALRVTIDDVTPPLGVENCPLADTGAQNHPFRQ